MASLTPKHRSGEVTDAAMSEGLVNGTMTLSACLGGLYAAMQNPSFVKYTNWQSRTAITIMPALFVFALTSELKMAHRMEEVAEETEHAIKSVEWANQKQISQAEQMKKQQRDEELRKLYRQAVLDSGVRLVETPELTVSHKAANFIQANPFKCIAAIGVPAVAIIFYGRSGKEHLSLQLKILHTRVFGQFAIICTLLGVMGLKDVMDRHGKFITENEVQERIRQMEETRNQLLDRLDYQAKNHPSVLKGKNKWNKATT